MDAILAVFDIAPPPHRRITTPSMIAVFAHIHTQAETTTPGTGSAVWGLRHLFVGENRVQSELFGCKTWPDFRCLRHHPASALVNRHSWFDCGLRAHPCRGGNTDSRHRECGVGSAAAVSGCENGVQLG